jgi:translation initiation factor 1
MVEPEAAWVAPEKQTARVRVERRPKGKVVTVVRGLTGPEAQVAELSARLKSACGSGGTVKEGVIEVQGDHVERVEGALLKMGYRVRRG